MHCLFLKPFFFFCCVFYQFQNFPLKFNQLRVEVDYHQVYIVLVTRFQGYLSILLSEDIEYWEFICCPIHRYRMTTISMLVLCYFSRNLFVFWWGERMVSFLSSQAEKNPK